LCAARTFGYPLAFATASPCAHGWLSARIGAHPYRNSCGISGSAGTMRETALVCAIAHENRIHGRAPVLYAPGPLGSTFFFFSPLFFFFFFFFFLFFSPLSLFFLLFFFFPLFLSFYLPPVHIAASLQQVVHRLERTAASAAHITRLPRRRISDVLAEVRSTFWARSPLAARRYHLPLSLSLRTR